jgi:Cu(I)/Ag(I) efflux system membrane protein CusA/SilA
MGFRRVTETLIVMLSVPFALVGGLWLMWWLSFNLAVAVGFIALAGVAAETGVVMLIYLDNAMIELQGKREAEQQPFTRDDLHAALTQLTHLRLGRPRQRRAGCKIVALPPGRCSPIRYA